MCPFVLFDLCPQVKPSVTFTNEELEKMTERIQNAGTEVVNAKAGAVSETLSLALIKFIVMCACNEL